MFILLLVLAGVGTTLANAPSLDSLGVAFHPTNLKVIWVAPTNDWPATLWTYRVLPAEFSPAVISNLMEIGSFAEGDRTQRTANPPFNDPRSIRFQSADQGRELGIFPKLGWVYYSDRNADLSQVSEGVPKDEADTLKRAIELLSKLGVDPSELARKPRTSEFDAYYSKKTTVLYKGLGQPAYATNVTMRGVMISRSIDGVKFLGKGARDGCWIDFGNAGKVSQLKLLWRNLEPEELCSVVSPRRIQAWIREGKAVLEPPPGQDFDWTAIEQITVSKATPSYFGEEAFVGQNCVYPFVTLEAVANIGQTNTTVYLHCPLIDHPD
jgi:hypothetical protein